VSTRFTEGSAAATDVDGVVAVEIVDADVHPLPRGPEELREYLPDPWRQVPAQLISSYPLVLYLPPTQPLRRDAIGPNGEVPGSDPDFSYAQLVEQAGVDLAVLLPLVRNHANPDYESALCQATNEWLAATWLSAYNAHGRYRGSINVCAADPRTAAREIERWAGHPTFVQVRLNAYAGLPYGDPFYDPIYEAATRSGHPVAVHFSKGAGMSLLTPAGFSSYFFEHHALYPVTYAAHVVSLVCNGTFDRFEDLRFVFVEGGFGWVLPLLWRLENNWDALAREVPARRRPTEYLRDHVRFTSQPIEEPERRDLLKVLDWIDAEHLLLFSSDYPHWDFDDPKQIVHRMPKESRRRIFRDNALELYGLPETLPSDDQRG
jgi:predicted TIM-barrel fold metal-dependent hydrolase